MPVFFLEVKKYLRSPSTYILPILTFSVILIFTIILFLNFSFNLNSNSNSSSSFSNSELVNSYKNTSITNMVQTILSLTIGTSIFVVLKTVSMYKSEVSKGSFLLLVSKPTSRTRIILEKWLALFCATFLILSFVVLLYSITIFSMDPVKNIPGWPTEKFSSVVFGVGAIFIFSIFLFLVTFSSIILLISIKLKVSWTIALGTTFIAAMIYIVPSTLNNFSTNNSVAKITNNLNLDSTSSPKGETVKGLSNFLNSNDNLENSFANVFNESENLVKKLNSKSSNSATNLGVLTGGSNSNALNGINIPFQLSVFNDASLNGVAGTAATINSADTFSNDGRSAYGTNQPLNTLNVTKNNILLDDALDRFNNSLKIYNNFIQSDQYKEINLVIVNFLKDLYNLDAAITSAFANNPSESTAIDFYNELNEKFKNTISASFTTLDKLLTNPFQTIFVDLPRIISASNTSNPIFPNKELESKIINFYNSFSTNENIISSNLFAAAFNNLDALFKISSLIYLKKPATLIFGDGIQKYVSSSSGDLNEKRNKIFESITSDQNTTDFIASNSSLNSFFKENDFYKFQNSNPSENSSLSNIQQSGFYKELESNDLNTFGKLGKILLEGNNSTDINSINQVLSVESVSKLNKGALIAIYILIPLGLLPLTVYFIKKQDIR